MADDRARQPGGEPEKPVSALIESYGERRKVLLQQANELARMRDEVRATADREALGMLTKARDDIREVVAAARREIFVLGAQVAVVLGTPEDRSPQQAQVHGVEMPANPAASLLQDADATLKKLLDDSDAALRRLGPGPPPPQPAPLLDAPPDVTHTRRELPPLRIDLPEMPPPPPAPGSTVLTRAGAGAPPTNLEAFVTESDTDLRAFGIAPPMSVRTKPAHDEKEEEEDAYEDAYEQPALGGSAGWLFRDGAIGQSIAADYTAVWRRVAIYGGSAAVVVLALGWIMFGGGSAAEESARQPAVRVVAPAPAESTRAEAPPQPSAAVGTSASPSEPAAEPVAVSQAVPVNPLDLPLVTAGRTWLEGYQRGDAQSTRSPEEGGAAISDERRPAERFPSGTAGVNTTVDDIRVDRRGDTAVLTARLVERREGTGASAQHVSRVSQIWIRTGGSWRLESVRIANEARDRAAAR